MGYLGAKSASGAYQAIIALMPPHDTFIDLFAGSGVIIARKPRALRSYAVDIDPKAIAALPDLPGVVKVNSDARSFLDKFDYDGSGAVLIYADPPYVHSTRTSRARYRFEMTDAEHIDLLAQLRCVSANVILSGYPSALYDANLPGWNTRQFQAMTRGGPRTEKLWFNFDATEVQWCGFAGKNFTDRQRIKRKAARWAAKYEALPPAERLAVLSAILSAGIDEDDDAAAIAPIDDHDYLCRPPELFPAMVDRDRTVSEMAMAGDRLGILNLYRSRRSLPPLSVFPPMPDSGVTKLSPRESAERSAQ